MQGWPTSLTKASDLAQHMLWGMNRHRKLLCKFRGEEGAGDLTSLADQIAERELGPGHDAYVLDDGVDD